MRRSELLLGATAIVLALWVIVPLESRGSPQSRAAQLQEEIERKRRAVEKRTGRADVLTSDITGYSRRIAGLRDDIGGLQRRQSRIEVELGRERTQLERMQTRLRSERLRLARLRARLAEARAALAGRLVERYKADAPDVVTVVLESDGFAQLVARTEFLRRVSAQDVRIIDVVKVAKADADSTAQRLAVLERRQERTTLGVERRRDEVASVKQDLVARRDAMAAARATKSSVLARVRDSRGRLMEDLEGLEKRQAKIQATLARAGAGAGTPGAGPIRRGFGRFIWPVDAALGSPFGQRWGRLHAGVDLAKPGGTPIRAAADGKVALLQGVGASGGYGNYTCVQHDASVSTCYAHQSRFGTTAGASVRQGQVIGYVGNTGNSFGDHLHFEVRVGGRPVDPLGYL